MLYLRQEPCFESFLQRQWPIRALQSASIPPRIGVQRWRLTSGQKRYSRSARGDAVNLSRTLDHHIPNPFFSPGSSSMSCIALVSRVKLQDRSLEALSLPRYFCLSVLIICGCTFDAVQSKSWSARTFSRGSWLSVRRDSYQLR
jgi:hypothetical protein